MSIYISVLMLILIISCVGIYYEDYAGISKELKEKKRTILAFLIFIILLALSVLRDNVGTDYTPYKLFFENINGYTLSSSPFEIGYYLLNLIIHIFTNDYRFLFAVTSFLILFFINKTVIKWSSNYYISIILFVTLYFYFQSYNIVRQYIAIAIVFYSIKYIFNKNQVKFFATIACASLFHITALLFGVSIFLVTKKYNIKVYIYGFLGTLILLMNMSSILKIVGYIIPKYSYYSDFVNSGASSYSMILICLFTLVLALIKHKELFDKDSKNIILVNLVYIGLLLNILALANIVFYRASIYFYIFIILLIPQLLELANKQLRVKITLCLIFVSLIYCIYLLSNNNSGILPYQSYLL